MYFNIWHFRLIIRTPVALKIAVAMAALGGTALISPAPLAPYGHAIRKNEDKQQGGNLARATYSVYKEGPGATGRYRAAKPNPALKKVDEAFWEKFQVVSSGHELDVQRCYQN